MIPSQILGIWARGLLSIVLLVLGPILLYEWYRQAHVLRARPDDVSRVSPASGPVRRAGAGPVADDRRRDDRVFAPDWGLNRQTGLLALGLATTLWAVPKGPLVPRRLLRRRGADDPTHSRTGQVVRLGRPDGSELRVEVYGPPDGPPVVLTHGWGLDCCEWHYAKKGLAGCRLIVWDLPGLGLSTEPADHDYSLDNLARDLDAVLGVAAGRPAVLLGHSIGGMISLTFAGLFPDALGTRVSGLVLVNTTYTNPMRTTSMAGLKTAVQKPLIEPLLHLAITLSPLVRLMNWLSYANGSAARSNEKSGFSGRETRGQLDFLTSYTPRASPAVLARGLLGMLRYDATAVLPTIPVPVLVVTGDKDPVCKPEASHRMRADIPNAELVTFSPAKHEGLLEHHARFDETVRAFVLRCSAGKSVTGDTPI